MILVQGIGLSGYVPLEGAVVLLRFVMDYDLGVPKREFRYLGDLDMLKSSNFNILHEVIFFAVIKRFDDFVRSTIIRDVGLFSGYYRAGPVFPKKMLGVFKSVVGLGDYLNLYYFSSHPGHGFARSAYTTAWAEYISVDFVELWRSAPYFFIQMLGRFDIPLLSLRCGELREVFIR